MTKNTFPPAPPVSPQTRGEDQKREAFEQSTVATLRALGAKKTKNRTKPDNDLSDLRVSFGEGGRSNILSMGDGKLVYLRRPKHTGERDITRGQADRIAFKLRDHNPTTHTSILPPNSYSSGVHRFFDLLENLRTDAVGSSEFTGVAHNLQAAMEDRLTGELRHVNYETLSLDEKRMIAFEILAYQSLTGRALAPSFQYYTAGFENWFKTYFEPHAETLRANMHSQKLYAKKALNFLKDIFPELLPPTHEPVEDDTPVDSGEPDDNTPDDDNNTSPKNQNNSAESSDLVVPMDNTDKSPSDQTSEREVTIGETDFDEFGEDTESFDMGSGMARRPRIDDTETFLRDYKIFTTAHDEEVKASDLVDPAELKAMRQYLVKLSKDYRSQIAYVGRKLKNYLMAQQQSTWDFDLDDGMLDTARLSRVVTNPTSPLSFKQETDHSYLDTVVTILVDNSGSMRGRPIQIAATCTDIMAEALEQAGIKTEILGFTTRAWKGGKSREDWIGAGKPSAPGRLNDLRHIIYKPADRPLRTCRDNFGLMLKEGILKENIDGEALMWAYKRIMKRPEKRKIIIVISDGAPVDDSTSNVNNASYLEKHLRQVIDHIQTSDKVEISAIGIGHDVGRYYANSVVVTDADKLAFTLADRLLTMFSRGDKMRVGRHTARVKKQIQRRLGH